MVSERYETILAIAVWVALAAAVLPVRRMAEAGRIMRGSGGPGIVPFELAESTREADRILRSWGETGRAAARRSLQWDFAFIVAYVLMLAAAALYVAARADRAGLGWLAYAASVAAIGAILAGLLDCAENLTLLAELRATSTKRADVRRARWCAQVKFALVGAAGLVILVGFGIVQLAPGAA